MTTVMPEEYWADARETADALGQGEASDWLVARRTFNRTRRAVGPQQPGRATMEQWCEDVQGLSSVRLRFGVPTGQRYAKIWATYGEAYLAKEPVPTFKEAYAEVEGSPDRTRMMGYESKRLIEEGTLEQKLETVIALLDQPEVAETAADPRTKAGQVVTKVNERRERLRRRRQDVSHVPGVAEIDQARALNDLIHAVSQFASETQKQLGLMGRLPDPDKDAFLSNRYLLEAYRRAEVAMEAIGSLLRTGVPRKDVDDFFKSVVNRQA